MVDCPDLRPHLCFSTRARYCWVLASFHTSPAPGQWPFYQPLPLSRYEVLSALRGRAVHWVTAMVASTDVVLRTLGVEWALLALCCCIPSSSQQTATTPTRQGPSHMPLVSVFPSEALGVCFVKRSIFSCLKAHAGNCKLRLCLTGWLPDLMSFMVLVKPWLPRCYETG